MFAISVLSDGRVVVVVVLVADAHLHVAQSPEAAESLTEALQPLLLVGSVAQQTPGQQNHGDQHGHCDRRR